VVGTIIGTNMARADRLAGMEAPAVSVEVHLANGLPQFTIVGTNTPFVLSVSALLR
jgi:hypothetical protein